jgi:hypothetical protein
MNRQLRALRRGARVVPFARSLEFAQTQGFSEPERTGANARQPLPCRRSRVRVLSSALEESANRPAASVAGRATMGAAWLHQLTDRLDQATKWAAPERPLFDCRRARERDGDNP